MRGHVPPGKPAINIACGAAKLHNPAIRVQCALRRSGGQSLCEHALTDKVIASGACRTDRPHNPAIQVRPSVRTTG